MSANSENATQTNDNQAALASQQATTQAQIITSETENDKLINADMGTGAAVPTPGAMPSVSAIMGPGESTILNSIGLGAGATSETQAAAAVDPNETGILATFTHSANSTEAGLSALSADTLESVALGQTGVQSAIAGMSAQDEAGISTGEATLQTSLAAQARALTSSISAGSTASQYAMAQEAGGGGQGIANPLGTQISSVPSYSTDTTSAPTSRTSPVLIIGGLALVGGGFWLFETHHHKKAA